jgi:hypothetical protein
VKFWQRVPLFFSVCLMSVMFVLLSTAWFQIQAVRWGYKVQSLRQKIDEAEKKEQTVDQRLQGALSLARLDDLARKRFRLQVPEPSQIVLLSDT